MFIYNQAFRGSYLYARASAASMLVFVIIAILSAVMFFLLRDKDEARQQQGLRTDSQSKPSVSRKRGRCRIP